MYTTLDFLVVFNTWRRDYIFSPDFVQILAPNASARNCLFQIICRRRLHYFRPVLSKGAKQSKNSVALINVAINFGYEYFCFVIYFPKIFCVKTFSQYFFFQNFFFKFFFLNFFFKILFPNFFFNIFFLNVFKIFFF